MTILFFPDNTVLVNFALINRMDLLERLTNGHGTWCGTVAAECRNSAKIPELAAMEAAGQIFGTPLYPDAAELQDTLILRDGLARRPEARAPRRSGNHRHHLPPPPARLLRHRRRRS
jgi:hypothetical protein